MEPSAYHEAKCRRGHPLEIVSEGFAVCYAEFAEAWSAWAFTEPAGSRWYDYDIIGRDGQPIGAWVLNYCGTKEDALAAIQAEIDLQRSLPYDEERERARLMPV